MIGGEFDLSAGVMIGSSGLLLGILTTESGLEHLAGDRRRASLFGIAIGFINGITVVKTKLPSFIVTLGTFFVLRGLNAGADDRSDRRRLDRGDRPGERVRVARTAVRVDVLEPEYDFSVKVLWWLGLTAVGAWMLARTRFGNWIYGAGGDPVAARNVGVPVARTKIVLFMMTSTDRRRSGDHDGRQLRGMQAQRGHRARVRVHHRAVVGGCLLTGGYGSVIGAAFGAAMLGMAQIGIIGSQWD